MADEEQLDILKQGAEVWNVWRDNHPEVIEPDFTRAQLESADLIQTNLSGANLSEANLSGAQLAEADLSDADLFSANLRAADCNDATLIRANCLGADFLGANLSFADLAGANLAGANFYDSNLAGANLSHTRFNDSYAFRTIFADLDLRGAEGLETVIHDGPSIIGLSTIYLSEGKIPEEFLLGCGVPESFITQMSALVGSVQPIQFHSCFISYSTKDEEFARRLHARMRQEELRVWFAPEDMKGGKKLYEQIDRAIQVHDRLLLVLSEDSMKSEWVMTEIRRARKTELKEGRRKLFPIRLVDYEAIREWECFDADHGKDLAVEVREYYIPDFSDWKNHDAFEREFKRLYESPKAEA